VETVKVKELQELLKECSPDENVVFQMWEGCCGDSRDLTLGDFDSSDCASTKEKKKGIERIIPRLSFYPVPGYYSCIQVGRTLKANEEYWKDKKPTMLALEEKKK
jgi:hypothetical protein